MEKRGNQKKSGGDKKKSSPLWKWAFLLLLAINIAGAAFVAVRVTMARDQSTLTLVAVYKSDQQVATVTTTTSQLNQLINSYLKDYQTKQVSFKFYVNQQQAVLEANYTIMGVSVPLYVYFEPLALDNGSVSLAVKSVSAGSLTVPTEAVLAMVKSYNLPDFVQIDAKNNQIVLDLKKIKIGHHLYFKANQIDLPDGKFTFDLMSQA